MKALRVLTKNKKRDVIREWARLYRREFGSGQARRVASMVVGADCWIEGAAGGGVVLFCRGISYLACVVGGCCWLARSSTRVRVCGDVNGLEGGGGKEREKDGKSEWASARARRK